MSIPCYSCTHIIDTEEDGLKESYCEYLCDRGKESLIDRYMYMTGEGFITRKLYRTCGHYEWNKDLDIISGILADLWKRVRDLEDGDIELMRRPRDE